MLPYKFQRISIKLDFQLNIELLKEVLRFSLAVIFSAVIGIFSTNNTNVKYSPATNIAFILLVFRTSCNINYFLLSNLVYLSQLLLVGKYQQ